MDLVVKSSSPIQGHIQVPGDKSISHRALIIGSISIGETIVDGLLEGLDCLATLNAMRTLGVLIEKIGFQKYRIQGDGMNILHSPSKPIDCNNSGTAMRLLAGLLAPQPFDSILQGDASLSKRPMERIIQPLSLMGAHIQGVNKDNKICAPLSIHGKSLQGIDYTLPVQSAQIKSCILLAGLYAKGKTIIREKGESRDHTERLLKSFGCDIRVEDNQITLHPGNPLKGQTLHIPGDISSAAFFIGAASMQVGAHLVVQNVGVNPKRIGLLHILHEMGADISLQNQREQNDELVADLVINGAQLQGIDVPTKWVVSAMDEFPILFIVAACAKGETRISGISELRVKESDRLSVMCKGLKALGIYVKELEDGVIIQGGHLTGGKVNSEGDHRIAMAFAMAAFATHEEIHIQDCENINTSFPSFCDLALEVGLQIKKI
ncbi:MAG: 3-phosphoshikimate 1-carboxyvinyltransferase [Candidatus Berkiella sp.]